MKDPYKNCYVNGKLIPKGKPITSEDFKTKMCPVRKVERPLTCSPCGDCGSFPWIDG
jgi:hypothetical protein